MNELALFAGAGGGILGGKLLGWKTVCAVEIEPYCRAVLAQRQNDGILPPFPIWDDICTFDGKPWNGIVDVISGGFPCQDISCAGKGEGITGSRSGLWGEMFRVVCEVRPRFVFVENSPMLTLRGLGTVLSDLASVGYDAKWGVLGAKDAGAPHKRERIWIMAYAKMFNAQLVNGNIKINDNKKRGSEKGERGSVRHESCGAGLYGRTTEMADTQGIHAQGQQDRQGEVEFRRGSWWVTEPNVGRVANGVAFRVDRLKAIGNGQVSGVAKLAWEILTG
jgi:DNA (cytosine-5)-methyltransferase 1